GADLGARGTTFGGPLGGSLARSRRTVIGADVGTSRAEVEDVDPADLGAGVLGDRRLEDRHRVVAALTDRAAVAAAPGGGVARQRGVHDRHVAVVARGVVERAAPG